MNINLNSIINKLRVFCNSLNIFISTILIGYYNITIISINDILGVGNWRKGSVLVTCIQLPAQCLFLSI